MNQYPKFILLGLFALITITASSQKSIKGYIKKYDSLAIKKSEKYGIPVSIILGVSIVESAAGQSQICKALNNFFGIKGKNLNSQKKMGYKSAYKEYVSAAESFEHFCQVVIKKKFYKKLKGSADYKEWLNQMNKASYASAKQKWIDDITKNIKKYELYKFDENEKDERASTVLNR
jgi:flagellum-specific peptidoglycan hydrolase FlgJ